MYSHGLPVHHDDALCAALRDETFGVTESSLGQWIGHRDLDRYAAYPYCGCRNRCKGCADWRLVVSSQGDMAIQRVDPETQLPEPPDAQRLEREANAFRVLHGYAESHVRREEDRGLATYQMYQTLRGDLRF